MQAQQLDKPQPVDKKPLSLVETAEPQPGPGQIQIKVSVCGVCHTDLHTVEGDLDLLRLRRCCVRALLAIAPCA